MNQERTIQFTAEELNDLRLAYEKEYIELTRRLEHIRSVLNKIGSDVPAGPSVPVTIQRSQRQESSDSSQQRALPKPRKSKKRGPKSVWGDFIVRRLKKLDRPMSYAEMLNDAMDIHNIPDEKRQNAKGSILNSAFRLRKTHKRIETIPVPGRKEKFIVLTDWLGNDGKLMHPYAQRMEDQIQLLREAGASLKGNVGKAKPGLREAPESAKSSGRSK
jgi:hypothetical protein